MGAPKERYDRDLTAVRSRINFAGYLTDFGDMVVKICYGKELSHQSLTGLREFCKRLGGQSYFIAENSCCALCRANYHDSSQSQLQRDFKEGLNRVWNSFVW